MRLLSEFAFEKTVFVQSNLFENLGQSRNGLFDVIVSNPPYIPYSQTVELLKDGSTIIAVMGKNALPVENERM